ncbi:MAG: hypothetical protein OXG98_18535 [Gemmatimonadetes bacterium]|nr:hypothetical protein [Gemmatimonadota bacterium]
MATVDGIELLQLVCNNAFEPRWESYALDDLGADEVRVRSEITAAKHGTEKGEITGESIYSSVPMDREGRVFDRSRTHPYDPTTWKPVGNTTVGTVMAVGRKSRISRRATACTAMADSGRSTRPVISSHCSRG